MSASAERQPTAGRATSRPPTALFVLEQTLGHVTHGANLRSLVPQTGLVEPVFVPIEFDPGSRGLPGWSNWTVRAGMRATWAIGKLSRSTPPVRPDVMLVHTQVPAVLLGLWTRRIPTVVSLDATPKQYDELGESYAHQPGPELIERVKDHLNGRCFERAVHLVTWSEWARQGLVTGYGIEADRITAIAPGVNVDRWGRSRRRVGDYGRVRILFVGGNLDRKGGHLLLRAVRELRRDGALPEIEVHLVTNDLVEPEPGLVVHRGLTPNSSELIAEYQAADIFCLPTFGDCLPMVLAEGAASNLPLVSTDVGAIHSIVQPNITGELVTPGDVVGLVGALRRLVASPDLRRRYGDAARRLAEREHDARKNAARLSEILVDASTSRRAPSSDRL